MKTRLQTAKLNFLLVTQGQLDALMTLSVAQDENHLIAPVPDWLAEAAYMQEAISYGIYAAQEPIGLMSLIDPRLIDEDADSSHFQSDCLYVWRIMIDHRQRDQGYGTAAMQFIMNYAQCIGLAGVSLTTMDQERGNALPLYQSLGFAPTGRRLCGEIELICREMTTC